MLAWEAPLPVPYGKRGFSLGLVYADKGKSAEAVKAFNQALALKKDFPARRTPASGWPR